MSPYKVGSKGEGVKAIQKKLGISVDGIYGSQTKSAVQGYQKQKGLNVTGQVDGATWYSLFGTYGNFEKSSGSTGSGAGIGVGGAGGFLDKIIGGILLYGLFKVIIKAL